jgi:hypothetical protein
MLLCFRDLQLTSTCGDGGHRSQLRSQLAKQRAQGRKKEGGRKEEYNKDRGGGQSRTKGRAASHFKSSLCGV